MLKSKITLAALSCAAAALLAAGCSSHYVKAASAQNPPPNEAFKNFDRFEVQPIAINAPYAGQEQNEAARKKIQENLDERLNPQVQAWNATPARHSPARVLRIEPVIRDIRFISGARRIFGGAFAGSSAVVMDVKFVDAATGAEIARPEFYSHGNGFAGAYSFGISDNIMLIRPATYLSDYVKANYEAPVGGMTGAEG